MRTVSLAALVCLLFAATEGGQHLSGLKVNRGWKDLVGTWKEVALEGPDGKRKYEGSDPYLTIKNDPATGHLMILLQGNPDGNWSKLEIDPEKNLNLYWLHSKMVLRLLSPNEVILGSGSTVLWADPDVERQQGGKGVLRFRHPWVFDVDGDSLKLSPGYELAGMWNAPEWLNRKDRSGAVYYTRVKSRR